MRSKRIFVLAAASLVLLGSAPARAQAPLGSVALEQLDPSPPGDTFFGVPSPFVGGHIVPRALVLFDYASRPLSLSVGSSTSSIVGYQAFVHAGASLALFDRLLCSVSLPVAVAQGGDDPTIEDFQVASPSSAGIGDLRLGLRIRLLGEQDEVFQIGVSGSVFLPTGSTGSFTGEGAVRIAPQLLFGGHYSRFVWSASLGGQFRASDSPSTITYGAGVGVMLFDDRLQIGPEAYAATPLQDGFLALTETRFVPRGTTTNAELLLGVRARLFSSLVAGVAAGPGLSDAIGTPPFRALVTLAWSPPPSRSDAGETLTLDADADGLLDNADACPHAFGPRHANPGRNGCPVKDVDDDGIPDEEDACPDKRGVTSADAQQNGCPPDRDGDGVQDLLDACADERGDASANGCPPTPTEAELAAKRDTDGDGILDSADACPKEKGLAAAEPTANGCPRFVRVTDAEITISAAIKLGGGKPPLVEADSEPLLTEVRDVLVQHPELTKIEVQGHTDNVGNTAYNQQISAARASAVRKWLVDHGIAADRVVAKGYGPSRPIVDNKTADNRARNKRITFMVLERK